MKPHLTAKELSERWGISVTALGNWRRAGCGPKVSKRGLKRFVYMLEDVIAYEKENKGMRVTKD